MNKRKVTFLVTDLDDTLWDWLKMWHTSFQPYISSISQVTGVSEVDLKSSFKQLHRKYGSSEASFPFKELSCLTEEHKSLIETKIEDGKSLMHNYNSNKKHSLKLYDGVKETLQYVKAKGAYLIGYTESNAFFTKFRIKSLGLDGLFDCIYAPIDTGLPQTVERYYPEEYWEPQRTEFRYLPASSKKPNSEILEIILKDFNATKAQTIYIGDKLNKDIFMANSAGITSVYAEYGHVIEGKEYNLLKEVSHWTEEDILNEKAFKDGFNDTITPTYTIKNFSQLRDYFTFEPFGKPRLENLDTVLQVWQKTIDVQQHFNDIGLKIKNFALTLFTFILAGIGLIYKEVKELSIFNYEVSPAALFACGGILVLLGFFFMDKYWYHRLLKGAVSQGVMIEKRWSRVLPEINLTTAIGSSSPLKIGRFELHSNGKFNLFYLLLMAVLVGIIIFLQLKLLV